MLLFKKQSNTDKVHMVERPKVLNNIKLIDLCEDEDINNLFINEKTEESEDEEEKEKEKINKLKEQNEQIINLRNSYIETLTIDQRNIFLEWLVSDYYNIIDEVLYLKYMKIFDYGNLKNKPEELKEKLKNGFLNKQQYNKCLEYYNKIIKRLKESLG